MVYTVTFNPSLDYIVELNQLKLDEVNRTRSEVILPGGKGVNVSIVLKNLGIESKALGFIGGFTGKEFESRVNKLGVQTDLISIATGNTRINVKIRAAEETEINAQGPEIGSADIEKLYKKLDALKAGDVLVLAGSIPSTIPGTIYMDIMKYLEDKKVNVVVDATKDLLTKVLKYHPFLIKPNNYELGEIFGVELNTRDEVIPYARKLQELGAENVLVSMAGEGAVLLTAEGNVFKAKAPEGKVVNSVGAGDSMVAGFIAGYEKNHDYREAFLMGICTGSASAFSMELAKKEQVEELMVNNKLL